MKKTVTINPSKIILASAILVVGFFVIKRFFKPKKNKIQKEAESDLEFWKGKTETSPLVSDTLIRYWKATGRNFTPSQMQSSSVHSTYPWSSAYISDLVKRIGYKNFKGHASHSGYVIDAKKNRETKLKDSLWAYKPSEGKKVEVGDILVKPRSGTNPTLDTLTFGTNTHGDLIIDILEKNGKSYARGIGGNLGNTVSTHDYELTSDGKIKPKTEPFAHLKYKN